jgi:putative transposase
MTSRYAPDHSTVLEISGVSYALLKKESDTLTYARIDAPDDLRVFTHKEFGNLLGNVDVRLRPLEMTEGRKAALARTGTKYIGSMPKRSREKALWKEAWVMAGLAALDDGRAKRTEASLNKIIPNLNAEIEKRRSIKAKAKRAGQLRARSFEPPCARSLLQWMRDYQKSGRSALALVRKKGSGRFGPEFCPETTRLLNRCINESINMQRLNMIEAHKNCRDAFAQANVERSEANLPPLHLPSLSTFRRRVSKMNAHELYVRQHGREAARRKFRFYEQGLNAMTIGGCVALDSYKTDAFTVLSWVQKVPDCPDVIEKLKPIRLWIIVAIDCATRCIVGFKLSFTPNAEAAVEVLGQIGRDKSHIAASAGCTSPWNQSCGVSEILADNGAEFISPAFQMAVTDLGWTMTNTVAAMPELRGSIERLFRTVGSKLLAHLPGRAFSNVIERGDYSSEALAALDEDELTQAFLLFFVDIYHNEPHAGLNGATHANTWLRLSHTMGKIPEPDPITALAVFGVPVVRKLGRGGVLFSGIRYVNDVLREELLRNYDSEISIRVDPQDVGWIAVFVDDEWHPAFAVNAAVRGMSYQCWRSFVLEERARNRTAAILNEDIIVAARKRQREIAANAMARANVSLPLVTSELLQLDQQRLFIGLSIREDVEEPSAAVDVDDTFLGDEIDAPEPMSSFLGAGITSDMDADRDDSDGTDDQTGGTYFWPDLEEE